MKKTILTAVLAIGTSVGVFAQGTVAFDNQNNVSNTPTATASGYVFKNGALATSDFNALLMGGSSTSNLTVLATLLQSDGTILSGASVGAPGQWIDLTGASYTVNGVAAGGTAFLDVQIWEGNFSSMAAAKAAGMFGGDSGIFQNPTGGGALPPADLTGMPSFALTATVLPEPTTLAFAGLGAASLLLFRRKK